jgi:hypothetical protein
MYANPVQTFFKKKGAVKSYLTARLFKIIPNNFSPSEGAEILMLQLLHFSLWKGYNVSFRSIVPNSGIPHHVCGS